MAIPVVSTVAGGFLPQQRQQKTLTERAYDLIVLILLIFLVVGGLYFLFSFVLTSVLERIAELGDAVLGGTFAVFKAVTPLGFVINVGTAIGSWFKWVVKMKKREEGLNEGESKNYIQEA